MATTQFNPKGLGPTYSAPTSTTYSSGNGWTEIVCSAVSPNYFYLHHAGENLYFTDNLNTNYTVIGSNEMYADADVTVGAYNSGGDYTTITCSTQTIFGSGLIDICALYFPRTGNYYNFKNWNVKASNNALVAGDATGEDVGGAADCSIMYYGDAGTYSNYATKVFVSGDAGSESATFRIEHDGDTYNSLVDTGNNHKSTTMKVGGELSTTIKKHYGWVQFNWKDAFSGDTAASAQLQLEVSSAAGVAAWMDHSADGDATIDGAVVDVSADESDLSAIVGATAIVGTGWSNSGTTVTLTDSPDLSSLDTSYGAGEDRPMIKLGNAGNASHYSEWFVIGASDNAGPKTVTVTPNAPTGSGSGQSYVVWHRNTSIVWLQGCTGGDVPGLGDDYFTVKSVNDTTDEITLNVTPGGSFTGKWNCDEPIAVAHIIHAESDINMISTSNNYGGTDPPSNLSDLWQVTCGDYNSFDHYLASSWASDVFFRMSPSSGTTLRIGTSSNSNIQGQSAAEQETDLKAMMQEAIINSDVAFAVCLRSFNHSWDGTDTYTGPSGLASYVVYKTSNDATSSNWPQLTVGIPEIVYPHPRGLDAGMAVLAGGMQ